MERTVLTVQYGMDGMDGTVRKVRLFYERNGMDGTVRYNINVTLWTVRYGRYGMDSKVK